MLRIAAPVVSPRGLFGFRRTSSAPSSSSRSRCVRSAGMRLSRGRRSRSRHHRRSPIAAGATHSMAVTPSGQVWTWGDNRVGQLGTGDTVSHASPVPVAGLSNEFIAVSAGLGHSLALDYLGRVWSWGLNSDGQLGDGSRTRRLTPILVAQASDVVAIAAGSVHSLALRSDGRVLAWGGNLGAQLGDGTQHGPDAAGADCGTDRCDRDRRGDGAQPRPSQRRIGVGVGHEPDRPAWRGRRVCWNAVPRRFLRSPALPAISAGGGHSVAVTAVRPGAGVGMEQRSGSSATARARRGARRLRFKASPKSSRISAGATHTLATTSAGRAVRVGRQRCGTAR